MRGVGRAASAQLTWRALIGLNVQCHSKGKKKKEAVWFFGSSNTTFSGSSQCNNRDWNGYLSHLKLADLDGCGVLWGYPIRS
jgi:hypothetical protein